jgi:outer membrane protein assembly factor BamD (BamD/ComL family)
VLACYEASQRQARARHAGLRLKLRIQAPDLAVLPWELLYDPRQDTYICLSRRTPLVRYVATSQPTGTLAVTPPLNILGVVASPEGLPKLDVLSEQRRMEAALHDLMAEGRVELTWLRGQTWEILRDALLEDTYHMLHFVGHGGYDAEADEGLLAFADETGQKQLLTATQVGHLLDGLDNLRLVVLNACEGARGSERDLLSSTAARLVRGGVPAVVAMQYAISDEAAIQFGSRFYTAVAHGMPVDAAVAEARIGMSVATRESAEWGTPVLYMQAPDGQIFDLAPVPTAPPVPSPDGERAERLESLWTRGLSAYYTERWERAAALLGELTALQPGYRDAAEKLEEARRRARLTALYAAGARAYEAETWVEAIEHLEGVVALDPAYRDAAALLEEAGRHQRLADLYAEARALHRAGAWQAAVRVFERVHTLDPEYPDPEGLEVAAREAAEAEAREREREAVMRRALDHMDAREWPQAIEALEALEGQHLATEETAALLARARDEAARQAEAERTERVEALATTAEQAREAGAWNEEVRSLEELLALAPEYPGAAVQLDRARRRREAEKLYVRARTDHAAGNWQGVIDAFRQIHALDAAYPDPDGLLAAAQMAQADALNAERRQHLTVGAGSAGRDEEGGSGGVAVATREMTVPPPLDRTNGDASTDYRGAEEPVSSPAPDQVPGGIQRWLKGVGTVVLVVILFWFIINVPCGGTTPTSTPTPSKPAATVTNPVAPPPTPCVQATWVVRRGDFMVDIAATKVVPLDQVKAANPTVTPENMLEGTVLTIPCPEPGRR